MAATIQTMDKPTRVRGLDTSGNNNHAQIYSGRALEFDGVTDYLSVSGSATPVVFVDYTAESTAANRAWTVAVWIKFDSASTSYQYICGNDTSYADSACSAFLVMTSAEKLAFYDLGASTWRPANTILNSGTWYRAVWVFDGVGTVNFYVNGVADGSGTLTVGDNNNADLVASIIGCRINSGVFENAWTGKMSDLQGWQGAWTQEDITYDYLNPDQLVSNRSNTSIDSSNLKFWYPMNEGHRGNQSYVLDASNTGPVDVISGYGTFTDSSKWSVHASTDANNYWEIDTNAQTMRIVSDGTYIDAAFHDTTILELGQTYKITVEVTNVTSGSIRILPRSGGLNHTPYSQGVLSTVGTHEFYYQSAQKTGIAIARNAACDITIKNLTVEAVNAKHNATTVFYGDEQITDAKNRTGFSSHEWTHYGSASGNINVSGGKLFITCNSSAGAQDNQGAQLAIAKVDAAGGSHPIVAGRTYRIQADLDFTTIADSDLVIKFVLGNNGTTITASDGSPNDGTINATEQTYYADVTTADATGNLRINCTAATNDSGSDNIFSVDNVSVKEVGTAMGWTDADQQLDIPQTALQSYNQLAWPHGKDSAHVAFSDGDSDLKFTTGAYSISFWFMPNSNTLDGYVLSKGAFNTSGYYVFYDASARTLKYYTNQSSASQANTSSALTLGKWYHCAVTITNSGTVSRWYINGEAETPKTDHTVAVADTRNFQIYNRGGGANNPDFGLTEISIWNKQLSAAEVTEIYNEGLALDATTHSASSNLLHYWRNNGLGTWTDIGKAGSLFNGTPTNITETMLITAGADSSRDSQGFLMNSQRNTECLNLPLIRYDSGGPDLSGSSIVKTEDGVGISDYGASDWSVEFWFKSKTSGEPMFMATHQEASNSAEGWHIRWSSSHTIYFVVSDGTDVLDTAVSNALAVDEWHHIICSYDYSADKKFVYINGVLRQIETDTNIGTIAPDADLHIGTRRGEGTQFFIGQIDDFKIYNKLLSDGGVSTGVSDAANLSTAAKGEVLRNYKAGKRSHK